MRPYPSQARQRRLACLLCLAVVLGPIGQATGQETQVGSPAARSELSRGPGIPPAGPAPAAAGVPARAGAPLETLPRELSPWGMFLSADAVVKAVMISLALASAMTWTVWFAKGLELRGARRRARAGLGQLDGIATLRQAVETDLEEEVGELVDAAAQEAELSADLPAAGIKERVASRLERVEAARARAIARGTGVLATVGATAPFVGLFGTVWGIMNSFVGISKAQTTNLAVVAPGIAEALLATALGLVAAVPAVVIYNHLARSIAGYRALLADASAEVLRLVGRDLDRSRRAYRNAAE